jgi:hypothetical protein
MPGLMLAEHRIENAPQLANTSHQSYFPRLTTLEQLSIMVTKDRIMLYSTHSSHVQQ